MRTVALQLKEPRVITFDFGTLCAIETAMGKNLNEILEGKIDDYFVAGVTTKEELQPDQAAALTRRWNVGFMSRFIAACLQVSVADACKLVPVHEVVGVFYELLSGFVAACSEFNGGKEIDAPGPQTASAPASEPGHGSSSESSPTA